MINKDTGTYADQTTVETLTDNENKAWSALDGVKPKDNLNDNEKYHIYGKDGLKVDKGQTLDPKDAIDVKDADGKETTLPEKSKVEWTKDKEPDFSQAGKDVTGEVTVTYPDHTQSDSVPVTVHVTGESDNYDPKGPKNPDDRVPVKDPEHLTKGDKDNVKGEVGTVNPNLPKGTEVEVDDKGNATIKYPDKSTDTIPGSDLVRPTEDKDNYDPKGPKNPDDRVPVKDPEHLTKGDKDNVKGEVGKVNPNLPKGTEVDVDDKGNATIKYPDGSKDTIPGSDLVRKSTDADQSTDADKITPNVPATKVPVTNPSQLTDSEKDQVKTNVTNANKDTLPSGSKVTVGDDGTATITYSDGSKDTIPGRDLIIGVKGADISGNKHDSNSPSGSNRAISNTDDETSGNTVNNAEGMNGNTAKSGSKNNSLKTLPQTGNGANEKASALGFLFAGLASIFSLAGRRKKKY